MGGAWVQTQELTERSKRFTEEVKRSKGIIVG